MAENIMPYITAYALVLLTVGGYLWHEGRIDNPFLVPMVGLLVGLPVAVGGLAFRSLLSG